ncbi:uncharacterized protein LOC128392787 isoform X1 [Panonychus citri]|uniref:uncharacterized protein LOC128392787 isoform X1 n=1 Tax=Panonychus citri TaxID=50023 RepID=UPI0023074185|nr:uncharacterized protein LOC128392787 isoform X1 [Panonychus citri]
MKTIIKLITFIGLLSVCFGLSLPREFLNRICETAKTAKKFGLSRERVSQMAIADFSDFTGKIGLNSGLQKGMTSVVVDATNNGGFQGLNQMNATVSADTRAILGILTFLLELFESAGLKGVVVPEITGNFQFPGGYPNLFKPTTYPQISETLTTTTGHQVSSTLDPVSCSQLDFPEKLDTSNKTDVQQAKARLALSGLKVQAEKLKKLENIFTDIQEKLFS